MISRTDRTPPIRQRKLASGPKDATGRCLSGPERCNGPSESLAAVLAMPWRPRVSVVAKFDFPPLGSRTSPSLACRRRHVASGLR